MKKLQKIRFGKPSKSETILLVIAGFLLFWMDISANKAIDLSVNYQTTWFGSIKTLALWNFWAGFLLYFVVTLLLIINAVYQRNTHYSVDIFIGGILLLGLSFIVGGFIAELAKFSVPVVNVLTPLGSIFMVTPVFFYHIGIFLAIVGNLMFAITE